MSAGQQEQRRVRFSFVLPAWMMGIDGTWRRQCSIEEVTDSGASLRVEGSLEGLCLKEFFLLLSSTGLAYRRCELAWVDGGLIGVSFLRANASVARSQPEGRGVLIGVS